MELNLQPRCFHLCFCCLCLYHPRVNQRAHLHHKQDTGRDLELNIYLCPDTHLALLMLVLKLYKDLPGLVWSYLSHYAVTSLMLANVLTRIIMEYCFAACISAR